jgi:hypothetical protein
MDLDHFVRTVSELMTRTGKSERRVAQSKTTALHLVATDAAGAELRAADLVARRASSMGLATQGSLLPRAGSMRLTGCLVFLRGRRVLSFMRDDTLGAGGGVGCAPAVRGPSQRSPGPGDAAAPSRSVRSFIGLDSAAVSRPRDTAEGCREHERSAASGAGSAAPARELAYRSAGAANVAQKNERGFNETAKKGVFIHCDEAISSAASKRCDATTTALTETVSLAHVLAENATQAADAKGSPTELGAPVQPTEA